MENVLLFIDWTNSSLSKAIDHRKTTQEAAFCSKLNVFGMCIVLILLTTLMIGKINFQVFNSSINSSNVVTRQQNFKDPSFSYDLQQLNGLNLQSSVQHHILFMNLAREYAMILMS